MLVLTPSSVQRIKSQRIYRFLIELAGYEDRYMHLFGYVQATSKYTTDNGRVRSCMAEIDNLERRCWGIRDHQDGISSQAS